MVRTWHLLVVAAVAFAALGAAVAVPLLGRGSSTNETTTVVVVAEQNSAEQAHIAQANVRAAEPAMEAYYADHGTYLGATADQLRSIDSGIHPTVTVVFAHAERYCIESTVDGETASSTGPGFTAVPARCSSS